MPILKFTVHKTTEEEFYFRLRNIADEVMITSRNYSGFSNCINDICCLQAYKDFSIEQDLQFATGQYRFALRSVNGRIIAKSPYYLVRTRMIQDMKVICENMREAAVEDRSTLVKFFRRVNTKI